MPTRRAIRSIGGMSASCGPPTFFINGVKIEGGLQPGAHHRVRRVVGPPYHPFDFFSPSICSKMVVPVPRVLVEELIEGQPSVLGMWTARHQSSGRALLNVAASRSCNGRRSASDTATDSVRASVSAAHLS